MSSLREELIRDWYPRLHNSAPSLDYQYPSAAHERIPAAQPVEEAPPGDIRLTHSGVAQSAEQAAVNRPAAGSSPAPGAMTFDQLCWTAQGYAYPWNDEGRPLPLV